MDKEDVVSTMEYYSATKTNEILPFAATWMDLEGTMLSEISQTEILYDITYTEKEILYDITYMCNLKHTTN